MRRDRLATSSLTPSLALHSLRYNKTGQDRARQVSSYLGFNIFGSFIRFERHWLAITDHYGRTAAFPTKIFDIQTDHYLPVFTHLLLLLLPDSFCFSRSFGPADKSL